MFLLVSAPQPQKGWEPLVYSVNVIIWLLLTVSLGPKVIQLSGAYCLIENQKLQRNREGREWNNGDSAFWSQKIWELKMKKQIPGNGSVKAGKTSGLSDGVTPIWNI